MALFFGIFSDVKTFRRISKKGGNIHCIFFQTERVKVLQEHLKSKGRGSAKNTPLVKIKIGEKQKFRAGLCAWVEFIGVPQEVMLIDGRKCLKIKIILPEEGLAHCYSEIIRGESGDECFCLQLVA